MAVEVAKHAGLRPASFGTFGTFLISAVAAAAVAAAAATATALWEDNGR